MKMKPCPFCGGEDLYLDDMILGDHNYYFIVCRDCSTEGPMCETTAPKWNDPAEMAKKAWNRRIKVQGMDRGSRQ